MSSDQMPEEFVQQVRDVLAHLYDTAYLQRHALLAVLVPADLSDPRARAQSLRETTMQAIAALRPPAGVSPRDAAYRPYAILRGKYVEGMSGEAVQEQLTIGRRQFFREQQRAIEGIASLLWSKRMAPATTTGDGTGQALSEELEQLGIQSQVFVVEAVVREAIAATSSLAADRGVCLHLAVRGQPQAFADETIARHLLISLFGALVRHSADCRLEVSLAYDGRWVCLSVTGFGETAQRRLPADGVDRGRRVEEPRQEESLAEQLQTQQHLAGHMGGQLTVEAEEAGRAVRLRLPTGRKDVVAIVDDNPKTLHLFERYLEPYRYQPLLIQESARALAEIRAAQVDVVVLDIMMRDVDGWRILQSLRTDPGTRHIPVLICSVLNDAELAHSLGAAGYLRKPVSQAELVRALDQARQARDSAPGTPPAPSPASG
ncbi:MAG: response regulator [Anaerolineae bacterium]